jgi:hypothetical protein
LSRGYPITVLSVELNIEKPGLVRPGAAPLAAHNRRLRLYVLNYVETPVGAGLGVETVSLAAWLHAIRTPPPLRNRATNAGGHGRSQPRKRR